MRISDWSSDVCSSDLLELVQTSARRHGRGDGADRGIALRLGNQGLGKNICIAWRPWRSIGLLAAYHVQFLHAVIFFLRSFCGRIALALLRYHVAQARPLGRVPAIFHTRCNGTSMITIQPTLLINSEFSTHN